MNGARFVLLLGVLAVAAAAIIFLGAPQAGAPATSEAAPEPEGQPGGGEDDTLAESSEARHGEAWADDDAAARIPADWAYRRTAVADLDGDALPERLVLASDVYVTDEGEPMWEDGHRWAVYVEEDDGDATLVYSGFVPLGSVSAAAGSAPDGSPRVLVLEQGPTRGRLGLFAYDGPGRVRLTDSAGASTVAWANRVAEEGP